MPHQQPTDLELSVAPPGVRSIRPREFQQFQKLIFDRAGIFLPTTKKALLMRRLGARVKALQLKSYGAYYNYVTSGEDPQEVVQMLDCISTNETHFFREPRQFEFLEREIFPAWSRAAEQRKRPRTVSAWSAGCSTGEEPFSIAMSLLDHLPKTQGWDHHVLATDLSTRVLQQAKSATWPVRRLEEVPKPYWKPYLLRGKNTQAEKIRARRSLRSIVRFQHLNLNDPNYPVGQFDLIFCRNVLIYFSQESKTAVVERLLRHLALNGFLFIGHAESLNHMAGTVEGVQPNIYRHPKESRTVPRRPDSVDRTAELLPA